MGMTIDKAISHLNTYSSTMGSGQTTQEQHEESKRVAVDTMRKYQQLQADYENRLKADLKAILVEIQLEIKELWDNRYDVWLDNQYYIGKSDTLEEVDEVIQQKIKTLRGEEHE